MDSCSDLVTAALRSSTALPRAIESCLVALLCQSTSPRISDAPLVALRRFVRQSNDGLGLIGRALDAVIVECSQCRAGRASNGDAVIAATSTLHEQVVHSGVGLGRLGALCAYGTGSVAGSVQLFSRLLALCASAPAPGTDLAVAYVVEWLTPASLAPGWAGARGALLSALLAACTAALDGAAEITDPTLASCLLCDGALARGGCAAGLLASLAVLLRTSPTESGAGSRVLEWVCRQLLQSSRSAAAWGASPNVAAATRAIRRAEAYLHAAAFLGSHGLPQPLTASQCSDLAAALASAERAPPPVSTLALHYARLFHRRSPGDSFDVSQDLCSCALVNRLLGSLPCFCGACGDAARVDLLPLSSRGPCLRALAFAGGKLSCAGPCGTRDAQCICGATHPREAVPAASGARLLSSGLRRPPPLLPRKPRVASSSWSPCSLTALPDPALARVAAFVAGYGSPRGHMALACLCRELREAVATDDERWRQWGTASLPPVVGLEGALEEPPVLPRPSSSQAPLPLVCTCPGRDHAGSSTGSVAPGAAQAHVVAPGAWRQLYLARRRAALQLAQLRARLRLRGLQLVGGRRGGGGTPGSAIVESCPVCLCTEAIAVGDGSRQSRVRVLAEHLVQRHSIAGGVAETLAKARFLQRPRGE